MSGFVCRNLRDDANSITNDYVEPLELHAQVLHYNPEAFEYVTTGKQSTLSCSFYLDIF